LPKYEPSRLMLSKAWRTRFILFQDWARRCLCENGMKILAKNPSNKEFNTPQKKRKSEPKKRKNTRSR
jgi:hypothetical protein